MGLRQTKGPDETHRHNLENCATQPLSQQEVDLSLYFISCNQAELTLVVWLGLFAIFAKSLASILSAGSMLLGRTLSMPFPYRAVAPLGRPFLTVPMIITTYSVFSVPTARSGLSRTGVGDLTVPISGMDSPSCSTQNPQN